MSRGGPRCSSSELDVPERARCDAAGALVTYVLGVAGQNAAPARRRAKGDPGRAAFLDHAAAQWEHLNPA